MYVVIDSLRLYLTYFFFVFFLQFSLVFVNNLAYFTFIFIVFAFKICMYICMHVCVCVCNLCNYLVHQSEDFVLKP